MATEQELLDLLLRDQQRETELETVYTDGHASMAQLAELEQVRVRIDHVVNALGELGYFNPC